MPRTARTPDGYRFTQQPDGSWSDGDLVFLSLADLLAEHPGTVVTPAPDEEEPHA